MNREKAKKYLVMAEDSMLDLQGAALRGWKSPVSKRFARNPNRTNTVLKYPVFPLGEKGRSILNPKNKSLAEHDKRFHPDGYKDGQKCKFRDAMFGGGGKDALSAAEEAERKDESDKIESARTVTWEGGLSGKSETEIGEIGKKFVEKYKDRLYDAVGEDGDGKFTIAVDRSYPDYFSGAMERFVEVGSRKVLEDENLEEAVIEALPEHAKDLDDEEVIGKALNQLTKDGMWRLQNMETGKIRRKGSREWEE